MIPYSRQTPPPLTAADKRAIRSFKFKSALRDAWIILRRLAMIATLGYAAHWGTKAENRESLKSFLKTHASPITETAGNFSQGLKMIQETLTERSANKALQAYHDRQRKVIQDYRSVGIEPVIKYAAPGTKEYTEEMKFYRDAGVFKANEDHSPVKQAERARRLRDRHSGR